MKNLFQFPMLLMYLMVLVSCTTDFPDEVRAPVFTGDDSGGNDYVDTTQVDDEPGVYFGFLDGSGSSSTYMDTPIESSASNLMVGRWYITKLGIDENNDGNIKYYEYDDFDHEECGVSFLQFNSDGVVFENSYYKENGTCTLFSEIDEYEFIEEHRLKIYVYDNIYVVNVTESELILKYDWNFENSLWGPTQVYYYYIRV